MVVQDQDTYTFWGMNLFLLLIIGIAVFGYFLLLIRKRWQKNFLHDSDKDGSSES